MQLGAIRGRLAVHRARIELLQAAGVLPAELPQLRIVQDINTVIQVVIDVFHRHNVPIEARREIRDLLDGRGRAPEAG